MVTMYLSSGKYALLLIACVCVGVYAAPKPSNHLNQNRETVRVKRSVGAVAAVIGPMLTGAVNDQIANGFRSIHHGTDVHPFTGILAENFANVSGSYQIMDDNLQRTVSIIAKQISTLPIDRQTNWQEIVNLFSGNPYLQMVDGSYVNRVKELNLGSRTNFFKFDGSPEEAIVSQVNTWFRDILVDDPDVLDATRITTDELRKVAEIVAQTGATVISLSTAFHRRERHTKEIIDINVIRFPDLDNPQLKLYRIHLTATSDCERIVMVQTDRNKINGVFQSLMYAQRDSTLNSMSPELMESIDAFGATLFLGGGDR